MSDQKREQEKKEVREFWIETTFKDDAYEPEFRHLATMAIRNNDGALFYPRGKFELYIERSAYDELLKERDAAIAERDELKEKYETDMASAKDAYDHKCEYENGIPPLCTVQGNLVQQLAKENDMLRKDAQGLVEALNYYKAWELDVNCTSSVGQEALKAWEGREK